MRTGTPSISISARALGEGVGGHDGARGAAMRSRASGGDQARAARGDALMRQRLADHAGGGGEDARFGAGEHAGHGAGRAATAAPARR
jgi:hypothetical protein